MYVCMYVCKDGCAEMTASFSSCLSNSLSIRLRANFKSSLSDKKVGNFSSSFSVLLIKLKRKYSVFIFTFESNVRGLRHWMDKVHNAKANFTV